MVKKWIMAIARLDTTVWVLLGFLISFWTVFFTPVFLIFPVMFMPKYVPSLDPIGVDMKQFIDWAYAWWKHGDPYLPNNVHAPLMHIFFLLAVWAGLRKAYIAITLINLTLFPLMLLVFPLLLKRTRQITPLMMLFAVTGLFSYGYQFELERGTFNLIAMSICFWSIYIFRTYPRWRYLAYLLFSTSIQLKLYPAIFALLLIRDWRAWKQNILRLASLGIFNIACLFALGPNVFKSFLRALRDQAENPYMWPGNASIRSYTVFYNHQWAAIPILVLVFLCLAVLVWIKYRERAGQFAVELSLACAIAAILIPPASHDTKLSFFVLPALLFFEGLKLPAILKSATLKTTVNRMIQNGLVLAMAALYAATLFSYEYKPTAFNLRNNLPILLSLLVLLTLFSIVQHLTTRLSDRSTERQAIAK